MSGRSGAVVRARAGPQARARGPRALGLTLAVLAAWAQGVPAYGAVLQVRPGGFPTISQALEAAVAGDVIRVGPGTYHERLVITKPISLEGDPGALLDGGTEGDVIRVEADGVAIRGMTITGGGRRLWRDESGIKVLGDRAVIEDNDLRQVLFGIHVWGSSDHVIRRNRITGLAALIEHDRGDGIRIFDSSRNTVEYNHIVTPRDGIYVEFASHNRIAFNRVEGGRIGLHYMFSDDNVFEGNAFVGNGVASAIMYSKRLVVRGNVFAKSYGYGAYGLFLKDADGALVEDNLMLANETGMSLDFAVRCTLRHNLVAANEVAARILASSQENVFVDNTFADNGEGVYLSPGNHHQRWDDGAGRGNYWSQYRGYDLDGDGIGDVAFDASEVFGHLVESYPELKLFFQSPAVGAIALTERAFPLVDRPRAIDRYPLMRPEEPIWKRLERLEPEGMEEHEPAPWGVALSALAGAAGLGAAFAGGTRPGRRRGARVS